MEFMVLNEVRSPSRISEKRKYLVRQKATEENTPNTFTRETLSLSPSNCKVSSVFSFRSETEAPRNNRPLLSHSYRTLSADYRPPEARLSVQRQKTADSAPSRVSSRGSSRQHSLSQGHSRVTLIRGESCSLVDIPTYLGSSVELGQLGSLRNPPIQLVFASTRPRLRIDLTKKKPEKSAKKTQWTVLCVAVAMMTMCVMLVGTMLSITSEYQDKKVSDMIMKNQPEISEKRNLRYHQNRHSTLRPESSSSETGYRETTVSSMLPNIKYSDIDVIRFKAVYT